MTDAIYGVFDNVDNAERAVSALKDHGVGGNEVSLVRRSDGTGLPRLENEADTGFTVTGPGDVAAGAMKGGAAGIALGILAGAIALTVPGIGPVLAAGPLAGALGTAFAAGAAGMVGGGVVGYLVDQGVSDEAAARYQAALHRGDILLTVRSLHLSSADAIALLEKYGATEISAHNVRDPVSTVEEPPLVDRAADIESPASQTAPVPTPVPPAA